MNIKDVLQSYSEWLDGESLVSIPTDDRTHEFLVGQFINGLDPESPMVEYLMLGPVHSGEEAGDDEGTVSEDLGEVAYKTLIEIMNNKDNEPYQRIQACEAALVSSAEVAVNLNMTEEVVMALLGRRAIIRNSPSTGPR